MTEAAEATDDASSAEPASSYRCTRVGAVAVHGPRRFKTIEARFSRNCLPGTVLSPVRTVSGLVAARVKSVNL